MTTTMNLRIETPPLTLREICLDKVRDAIITGYFPSGKRLVERSLCDELGVSRSVVREVIRYLEAEGLVEILPNKGPIVAVLDWQTASQIYEIRLLLEQSAVADCTQKLNEESKSNLLNLMKQLDSAFEQENTNEIIHISTQLYEMIFTVAEHFIAWEVVQRLNSRISRLRAMTMRSNDRKIPGHQHLKNICEAICIDQDAKKAKHAVAAHIAEASSVAQKILDKQ